MRTRSAATTQHQVVQALQRPHHARPPWTSHLPTGRACGQPLRGSWPAHRSPADAFGLTRFACPTPIDQRTQTLRQRPALSDPTQTPQTTDTSTVLPGGVWGGHRWRNLKWPSGLCGVEAEAHDASMCMYVCRVKTFQAAALKGRTVRPQPCRAGFRPNSIAGGCGALRVDPAQLTDQEGSQLGEAGGFGPIRRPRWTFNSLA